MSRRFLAVAAACLLALFVSRTDAQSNLIAQRTSKTALGVYLSHNLKPGHRYRLEVIARGHWPVVGSGFEYYTYFQNRRLYVGQKPLALHGTTPVSITFRQPISKKPAEWNMAENVVLRRGHGVTLQLFDLGVQK